MKAKRIAAALTAIAMSVSALSYNLLNTTNRQASELANDSVNIEQDRMTDMDIAATNSVGKYISNLAMQDEADRVEALAEYGGNFSIDELTFYPEKGVVLVKSTQSVECDLTIRIIDEGTGKECITAVERVSEGSETITEIRLNLTTLPKFYYVTADLSGVMGNLLCPTFSCNDYTQEMQEIYAADIYDFEPEYVVNFDDDESTNFLVLNESTIIAEASEDQNILVSADYENNVYVFNNYNDTIGNLKKDDNFFIYTGETDAIAVSVESVEFDGDQAVITASDDDIDDMFDFMKFEATADTFDAEVDMSTADESVQYAGLVYDEQNEVELPVVDRYWM